MSEMSDLVSILERALDPEGGGMSPALASQVLSWHLPAADHARYSELSEKAREGTLDPKERAELENYLNANDILTILKSKARISLRQHSPAA